MIDKIVLEKTVKAVKQHHMFRKGDGILIAFSGGADSVALLYVLHFLRKTYSLNLFTLHIHHNIRKGTADRDADFCRRMSARFGTVHFEEYADVPRIAGERGLSLEEAGRDIRYGLFEKYADMSGARRIATAHHLDDQAETVLMRLLRGTGPLGLGGIRPVRGRYIRPFLGISKAQLLEMLRKDSVPWMEDETNSLCEHTRNRIRSELLPFMERNFNPAAKRCFADLASLCSDDEEYFALQTQEAFARCGRLFHGGVSFEKIALFREHPAVRRRLVRQGLSLLRGNSENLSFSLIESVLVLASGSGRLDLGGGMEARSASRRLLLLCGAASELKKTEEERPAAQALALRTEEADSFDRASADNETAVYTDKSKVLFPLSVRTRRPGDRFFPLGAPGSRKLKDFLIDRKVPAEKRDGIPLVTDGDGHIIWVVGHALSERVKITGDSECFLKITIYNKE